ncbi:MAG TPA: hypothetical protein ENH67_09545 [Pseudoalteromonas sp.]|uniref:Uncharacterized protein n=1 Tax=marine sediment metagenome TaxID=412755 RepID=A0A0F9UJ79_9ZZZZ|nr:hypothetical protein [Pseudoalteromonas sp.]HDY93566.1 hypothetical protein [Pseudoalteromonas sp.]HDZ33111.1 hypothetical protein [Pseudoalteromonas sp.]
MNKKWYLTILLLTLLFGCTGIKLNPIGQAFIPPPPSLQKRTLWHDPSILQYKLNSLTGYIVHKSQANKDFIRVTQVLDDGYALTLEPLKDGVYYHSVINSSFASTGEGAFPILSVAANLSSEQAMELTINDKAISYINETKIPWGKLKAFKTQNPLKAGDKRFWVQATMLTQLSYKIATKIESDATVSGSAYKVGTQNYNAADTFTRTPYITMLTLDFDEALDAGAGMDDKSLTDKATSPQVIKGKISAGIIEEVDGIEVWDNNFPLREFTIVAEKISPPTPKKEGRQVQLRLDQIPLHNKPKVIEYAIKQAKQKGASAIVVHTEFSKKASCNQAINNCHPSYQIITSYSATLIKIK